MKRRDFLKLGAASAAWPILADRFGASAWALAPMNAMAQQGIGDRILVVLRLDGGNDGLATVIPLDRYDALAKARANVIIPAGQNLKLNDKTALHPKLKGLQNLFQDGKLAIVQAVGYPNHNQSHFRSTDIFFTASESNQVLSTGWLGRYLELLFTGFPEGYPNSQYPDPPSIQMGSVLSTLLQGSEAPLAMTVSNPDSIYSLKPDGVDTAPNTPAGHELTFIRSMAQQTQKYGEALKGALVKAASKSALWPASGNKLADQMQAVARLIAGGMRTPVYVVSLGGFDTHADQVDEKDLAGGRHGELMAQVDTAITAFQDELRLQGMEDRVMGLTVSEFGRRIWSNGSLGTDHGTSAPVLLFGKPVQGGVIGTSPNIPENATVKDNVPMQFDFRQVYATLLQEHLGLSAAQTQTVLLKAFENLPLVASGVKSPLKPFSPGLSGRMAWRGGQAQVNFTLNRPSQVRIGAFDANGSRVGEEKANLFTGGNHTTTLDLPSTSPGHLLVRLECEGQTFSQWVMRQGQ